MHKLSYTNFELLPLRNLYGANCYWSLNYTGPVIGFNNNWQLSTEDLLWYWGKCAGKHVICHRQFSELCRDVAPERLEVNHAITHSFASWLMIIIFFMHNVRAVLRASYQCLEKLLQKRFWNATKRFMWLQACMVGLEKQLQCWTTINKTLYRLRKLRSSGLYS